MKPTLLILLVGALVLTARAADISESPTSKAPTVWLLDDGTPVTLRSPTGNRSFGMSPELLQAAREGAARADADEANRLLRKILRELRESK